MNEKIEIRILSPSFNIDGQSIASIFKNLFTSRRLKWYVFILLFGFIGTITADTVTKPYTFTADSLISASEMNDNFDELYDLVNGNLDTNNIASIDASDIATGTIDTERLDVGTSSDQVAAGDHVHDVTDTWQAIGTTAVVTNSTTWVAMDDMSIDITLSQDADVFICFDATCHSNNAGGWTVFHIIIDGVEKNVGHYEGANPAQDNLVSLSYIEQGLTAGTHNVAVEWRSGDGGHVLNEAFKVHTRRQLKVLAFYQ